jgi:hypothetical protein
MKIPKTISNIHKSINNTKKNYQETSSRTQKLNGLDYHFNQYKTQKFHFLQENKITYLCQPLFTCREFKNFPECKIMETKGVNYGEN